MHITYTWLDGKGTPQSVTMAGQHVPRVGEVVFIGTEQAEHHGTVHDVHWRHGSTQTATVVLS